ncbi:DUF4386 domain-containing protein [Owenweeksia hongkongensis]|uniref:DUF4386 domain-containing protein n=1 Tax=Owenweeksia hongkongensis TaxID=253245 RepID=UPI003A957135
MKATNTSLSRFAIIAGALLLLMAITAGFSFGYAHSKIVLLGDANTTLQNLLQSKGLFQAEILGWCLILILDVTVAWALYHFFKSVKKSISALTAWIRIIYSIILGMAIGQLMHICNLLEETSEVTAQIVMEHIQSFENIWTLGLIVFGFHLIGLGYLALKSKIRFWGILLIIAGLSYSLVSILKQFQSVESLATNLEMILSIPMTMGELGFAVWLLIRGKKRTAAS